MPDNMTLFIVSIISIIVGAFMLYWFGVDGFNCLTSPNMEVARLFKDCILFFLGGVFLGVGIRQIQQ